MSEAQTAVLDMMIRHELAIKRLYEVFAEKYEKYREFWEGIAKDEQKHADLLATLHANLDMEHWLQEESQLTPRMVCMAIEYIDIQTARARENFFTCAEALNLAKNIESSLLDRQFAAINKAMPKDIELILTILAKETNKHLQKAAQAFAHETSICS